MFFARLTPTQQVRRACEQKSWKKKSKKKKSKQKSKKNNKPFDRSESYFLATLTGLEAYSRHEIVEYWMKELFFIKKKI